MSVGRLMLRTTVGGLFVGHGTQKLFGWFGGAGIEGATQMFGGLGLHPPKAHAVAAGATEAGCGAALVLGVQTPLAAAGLIATMFTAIRTVHWRNGLWSHGGGWEYNAVLIAACAALAETGPGRPALGAADDAAPNGRRALTALALGAIGAGGVQALSSAIAPPPEATAPGDGAGAPAQAATPEPSVTPVDES